MFQNKKLLGLVVICHFVVLSSCVNDLKIEFVTKIVNFIEETQFFEFVNKDRWLLLFYMPTNTHSAPMMKLFLEAKQLIKDEPLRLAGIDVSKAKSLKKYFHLSTFPSLIYYREGVYETFYGRTIESILDLHTRLRGPEFKMAMDMSSLEEAEEKANPLHPAGESSFFYIPNSRDTEVSHISNSLSFQEFARMASIWGHSSIFYVCLDGDLSNYLRKYSIPSKTSLSHSPLSSSSSLLVSVRGNKTYYSFPIGELFSEEKKEREEREEREREEREEKEKREEREEREEKEREGEREDCERGEERSYERVLKEREEENERMKKRGEEERERKRERKEKRDEMNEWVSVHRFRKVDFLTKGKIQTHLSGHFSVLTFFENFVQMKKSDQIFHKMEKIAKKFENEFIFIYTQISDFPSLAEKLGIKKNSLPSTIVFDYANALYYECPFEEEEEEIENILNGLLNKSISFKSAISSYSDFFLFYLLQIKSHMMNPSPTSIVILLVCAMTAGFLLFRFPEDVKAREKIVMRRMIQEREEEERRKAREVKEMIEEEERKLRSVMNEMKKEKREREGEGERRGEREGEGERRGEEEKVERGGNVVVELERLISMKEKGYLSEEEFAKAKKSLL